MLLRCPGNAVFAAVCQRNRVAFPGKRITQAVAQRSVVVGDQHQPARAVFEPPNGCQQQLDIKRFLQQRNDTVVSSMFDYFRLHIAWPGYKESRHCATSIEKGKRVEEATQSEIAKMLPGIDIERRFVPYISMFEFEAVLFSDVRVLAEKTGVSVDRIEKILEDEVYLKTQYNDMKKAIERGEIVLYGDFEYGTEDMAHDIARGAGMKIIEGGY